MIDGDQGGGATDNLGGQRDWRTLGTGLIRAGVLGAGASGISALVGHGTLTVAAAVGHGVAILIGAGNALG